MNTNHYKAKNMKLSVVLVLAVGAHAQLTSPPPPEAEPEAEPEDDARVVVESGGSIRIRAGGVLDIGTAHDIETAAASGVTQSESPPPPSPPAMPPPGSPAADCVMHNGQCWNFGRKGESCSSLCIRLGHYRNVEATDDAAIRMAHSGHGVCTAACERARPRRPTPTITHALRMHTLHERQTVSLNSSLARPPALTRAHPRPRHTDNERNTPGSYGESILSDTTYYNTPSSNWGNNVANTWLSVEMCGCSNQATGSNGNYAATGSTVSANDLVTMSSHQYCNPACVCV